MKKILSLMTLTLALSGAVIAQKGAPDNKSPTERETETVADVASVLRRGSKIGAAKKVSLSDVLKKPEKFAGKTVRVEGVVVRSCKMEGCWMELAPTVDAKSVRVTFKDHTFFIPLDSAGMRARAEGVFKVKTLSKTEVDHLVNEDGAKFANINKDGTVTEIAFEAVGVELSKQNK